MNDPTRTFEQSNQVFRSKSWQPGRHLRTDPPIFASLRPRAVVLRLSPQDCAQIQQKKRRQVSTAQGRCPPATPLLLLRVNIGARFGAATSATTCKLPSFLKPENHAESIGHPPLHSNPHRCAGRRYPGIVLCRRNPATGRGAGVAATQVEAALTKSPHRPHPSDDAARSGYAINEASDRARQMRAIGSFLIPVTNSDISFRARAMAACGSAMSRRHHRPRSTTALSNPDHSSDNRRARFDHREIERDANARPPYATESPCAKSCATKCVGGNAPEGRRTGRPDPQGDKN